MKSLLVPSLWLSFGASFQVVPPRNSLKNPLHLSSTATTTRDDSLRCNQTQLYSSSINLPSAYDISLPANLRGEAVRSALKSERGTCLDFSSPTSLNSNVGLVKVSGDTINFLNSKLSNSFSSTETMERIKLGSNVQVEMGEVKEAGLLTSKGRLIDRLSVLSFGSSNGDGEAYLMTTPGHAGSALFDRLDPFIFPLDGVKLNDMCPFPGSSVNNDDVTTTRVFTIIATQLENAKSTIEKNVLPVLTKWGFDSSIIFPSHHNECLRYSVNNANGEEIEMLLFEQTFLPSCCCMGYTLVIKTNGRSDVASEIWDNMVDLNNFDGPVALGPLEYETLRIEAGMSAFGFEMTGGQNNEEEDEEKMNGQNSKKANATPLELNLGHIVDETKGCYQGQEGIAAQLNNKRGVPRNLYTVIFPEEDNFYNDQSDEEEYSNHSQRLSNKTNKPIVGADLYVLGSDKKIKVGTLTSVAEQGGTSSSETVALALVRRSDPILKSMSDLGLEINMGNELFEQDPFWSKDYISSPQESGLINPPSLDPLNGVEVVVEESFTQGYLKQIPSLRLKVGQNMFETDAWTANESVSDEPSSVMGFIPQNESPDNFEAVSTATKSQGEENTEESIDETEVAKKKEKMEMLKKKAEEVMQKRREKKEASNNIPQEDEDETAKAAVAEAERKEKKMKLLKEKAEAAMKKRREKN